MVWKPIPNYLPYEASNAGLVRNADTRLILSPFRLSTGYLRVKIGRSPNGITVHRLVAMAFIGPCPKGLQVCHKNGDPLDNRPQNLRYGTVSDNAKDRIRHGRQADKRGERHHSVKLTATEVMAIRASSDTLKSLAQEYGVSFQQISKIRLGQRWSSLCL